MSEPGMPMDWRSPANREAVRKKIAEAMQSAGSPPQSHSPESMEEQMFMRSKTPEEYMNFVARLLRLLHERNQRNQAQMANQGPSTQMRPDSTPIGALQMMTCQPGAGTGATPPQNMPPQFQGGVGQAGPGMMMGSGGQPGMMQTGGQPSSAPGQPVVPGGVTVGPPRGPSQSNLTPQQQMYQQRMSQQRLAMHHRALAAQQQQQQSQQQQQQRDGGAAGMMTMHPSSTAQSMQSRPPYPSSAATMSSSGGGPGGPAPTVAISSCGIPMSSLSTAVHSPSGGAAAAVGGAPISHQMIRSPANYNHFLPSPTGGAVQGPGSNLGKMMHSPASSGFQGPPSVGSTSAGPPSVEKPSNAPSPGNPLSTPRQPSVASPAPDVDPQCQQKLQELAAAYMEPLRKWIYLRESSETESDAKKQKELSKMRTLLRLLEDKNPQKSTTINLLVLQKCENVLHNMLHNPKAAAGGGGGAAALAASRPPPVVDPTPPAKDQQLGQSLLEALVEGFKKPGGGAKGASANHRLSATFGPAAANLLGPRPRAPSPPLAKRLKLEEEEKQKAKKRCKVPHVLQGELARLPLRFRVRREPSAHSGADVLRLLCCLDDARLPATPPIVVRVPGKYPEASPAWDVEASRDLEATPFLRETKRNFSDRLSKMPELHSLSSLLDLWEMSVRHSCAALG